MRRSSRRARRLAQLLMRGASVLMPETRTDWVAAMRSELKSLEKDYLALGWAAGCLAAAIRARVSEMMIGNAGISKLMLALEMACCFVPLTLFWLLILFDGSVDPGILKQYFAAPDGVVVLAYTLSMAIFGICGPVGLFVALRYAARGRSVPNGPPVAILLAGAVLLAIAYVGTTLVLGGPGRLMPWLGGVLLFAILSVVGATQLCYLGRKTPSQASAT